MPYCFYYGEYEEERDPDGSGSGNFQYEDPLGTQFHAERVSGVAAAALNLLLAAGLTQMRVRYDGGSDEGFAHADDMWLHGDRKWLHDIVDLLNTPANVDAIRAAAATPQSSNWYKAGEYYSKLESSKVISAVLDELANAIATQLLGESFGTGEYELYGAAVVVFETGQMMDDPAAERN